MTEEYEYKGFGTLAENIEERILDSIRKGISSGEPHALRPLREVFQNCDDELADRFFIRIDKDALYFLNDGHRLTIEFNKEDKPIGGTMRMITGIAMASKRKDRGRAGEFGTGLRSAHAISHNIEVTGKTERHDHVDNTSDGEMVFKKSSKQISKFITAISNAYDKTLEESPIDKVPFFVRENKDRPMREFLPKTSIPRDGIMIRLPWRYEIEPGSNDPDEWGDYTWDMDRIQSISELYEEQIPLILLGCSWLREVVLEIDLPDNQRVFAWERNFNHRQIQSDNTTKVEVQYFCLENESIGIKDGLKFPLERLNPVRNEAFTLLTALNLDLDSIAEDADLLPSLHLLIPDEPSINLPAYTPIALVGDCGNAFGVTAYLPPDDSRTRIKIDGVKRTRQLWAALAMIRFSEKILPKLLDYTLQRFKNEPNKILKLLPRASPDFWFTEGNGMGQAHSHGGSAKERELSRKIDTAWQNMSLSWKEYRESIEEAMIFPAENGNWIPAEEVVLIKFNQPEVEDIARQILVKLGETVLSPTQFEELSKLNEQCWKSSNPLNKMVEVSSVVEFKNILSKHHQNLNLGYLGPTLVKQLYSIIHNNPPSEWEDDENLKRIPCIPNAEGKLLPLLNYDNGVNFFPDSETFPDLIPSSRRIHADFSEFVNSLDLNQPDSEELSGLVSEAALASPDVFDNLQDNPDVHRQVSLALVKICEGTLTQNMRNRKFIPCLYRGKITTRGMSRVGDNHVWPVDSIGNATRTSFQARDMIFFDEKGRKESLRLHPLIHDNLVWLDLHKDVESNRPIIRDTMKGNVATSATPGVNIIRALIFGLPVPTTNSRDESVFHIHNDGVHELDKWIERELEDSIRNEVLDSLLDLLRNAADKNVHKGMSTGWGADSRERLRDLKLLRDENEDWSPLRELCYDLRSDLSQLFEKRAVSQTHRDLLGVDVITKAVGKANGAGLGITQRISALEIIDQLNNLHSSKGVRSKIISMMLSSAEEWNLEESDLPEIEWIPTESGQYRKFSDVIVPTNEIVFLLGESHPQYLISDIDLNIQSVNDRAKELNMQISTSNPASLANALLQPETVWPGLKGLEILQHLSRNYADNPTIPEYLSAYRKNRLPDSNGKWHDNSWLVSPSMLENTELLYPEKNVVTSSEIGGIPVEEMAENWLLSVNIGPTLDILLEKLIEISSESKENLEKLEAIWALLNECFESNREKELVWPERDICMDLKFPVGDNAVRLSNVCITSEETADLLHHVAFFSVDEKNVYSELLECFNVINLEEVKIKDFHQTKADIENSEFDLNYIERYWIILAALRNSDIKSILTSDCWLYKNFSGFGFTAIKTVLHERKALVPESSDALNDLNRMIRDKCSFIWLP
ncbi:hypothetical protein N9Y75_02835, partial [Candidatus Poseidoniales archaeon]|nr:hypothetical protein [Candidatus Poseidoniales archaeon]